MRTVLFSFATVALLLTCSTTQAQFGKKLGDAVQKSAENATIKKAEQKTEQAVSKGIDKATDPNTYKGDEKGNASENQQQQQQPANAPANSGNANTAAPTANETPVAAPAQTPQQEPAKAAEMAYAKSDFVPGDEVMFDDQLAGEKMGEFPSQWDLLGGNAEISKIDGVNVIYMDKSTTIVPLMKTPKNYLPESYTIEFDFYIEKAHPGYWKVELMKPDSNYENTSNIELWSAPGADRTIEGSWTTTGNENRHSSSKADLSAVGWHRISISFNQRALKVYFDGVRTMNAPNVAQAGWFRIYGTEKHFIRDIRVAKGAVPLYDRMMSDGKFITYGITFDVGKSTIKPESMSEINRIVELMKENPDLKFSVEGHTDSSGNAATNQTLSEARSQAVVDKLVENGIAADRLKAAGKGQTSPLADNGTDEGRAKNRRVEFVKL